MLVLKGIPASPGIAIGKAVLLPGQTLTVSKHYIALEAVETELRKFEHSLQKTMQELDESAAKVRATLGPEYASLMDTHKLILQDPALKDAVLHKIQTDYLTAHSAISLTLQELEALYYDMSTKNYINDY